MIPALKHPPALPFWWEHEPGPQRDPCKLLSPDLPRARRFETEDDADRENGRRIARLKTCDQTDRKLAAKLCPEGWDGTEPCLLPACFHCARRYRIWRVSEQLRLFNPFKPDKLFAVHLLFERKAVALGDLADVNLRALKNTLYQQIKRVFTEKNDLQPIISGSLEVGVDIAGKTWLPHAHLIWGNCTASQIELLRPLYEPWDDGDDEGWEDLMVVQTPKDRIRTINYAGKFSTMYRPLRQTGPDRSPGARLPRGPEIELLHFLAQRRFEDFLLNFNIERHGNRLKLKDDVEVS